MRETILSLLLIVAISIGAQKYVPFPTGDAEWNIHSRTSEGGIVFTSKMLNYVIQGDTLINAKSYKKLYLKSFTTDGIVLKLKAAIREENKKIFMVDYTGLGYMSQVKSLSNSTKDCLKQFNQYQNYGNEYLLYDFNKNQIGDTLCKYQYGIGKIMAIDSIKIENSYRKRYKTQGLYGSNEYVIEGIGSVNQGFFGGFTPILACMTNFEWHFVSFNLNNECVYKSPDYKDCTTTARWDDIDFLKTGAEWYYGKTYYYSSTYDPQFSFISYAARKSVGDTIINNRLCHKINKVSGNTVCDPFAAQMIFYQSNDSLFFQRPTDKQFSLLCVYGAQKGDSWITQYSAQNIVKTIVDSVSTITINGKSLNKLHVRYVDPAGTNNNNGMRSAILEGIGDTTYLFYSERIMSLCDDLYDITNGLRCYTHPDLGTYHVPGTLDCSYVTDVHDNKFKEIKVYIHNKLLTIETESISEQLSVELMDVKGTVIQRVTLGGNVHTLNISSLDRGIYLYRITSDGVLLKAGKVIRN